MPLRNRPYILRAIEAHVPRKAMRDIWNRLRFGPDAPLSDAPIYVNPTRVMNSLGPQKDRWAFRRQGSGRVVAGDWDQSRVDIESNTKLRSCRMHWEQGADWEETPIFQRMLGEIARGGAPDDCRTADELRARYRALDRVFAETKQRGRLLSRYELPDYFRREYGATMIHVGRDGTCFRAGGGAHRFAIARILQLPEMPAQLGAVHPQAIADGHLARLSKPLAQRQ